MCTAIVQQYNACNIHTILLLTHRAGAVGIAVERRGALRPACGGEPKAGCKDCAQDQGSGRRVHIWTSAMQIENGEGSVREDERGVAVQWTYYVPELSLWME